MRLTNTAHLAFIKASGQLSPGRTFMDSLRNRFNPPQQEQHPMRDKLMSLLGGAGGAGAGVYAGGQVAPSLAKDFSSRAAEEIRKINPGVMFDHETAGATRVKIPQTARTLMNAAEHAGPVAKTGLGIGGGLVGLLGAGMINRYMNQPKRGM